MMTMDAARALLVAALALSAACVDAPASTPAPEPPVPGVVIDSIHPIEEEIRRFSEAVGAEAAALSGGASSRDELVSSFVDALASSDTAVFSRTVLSAAEFIDLYFPHTVYMAEPYQMDPAAIWFQMQNVSSRGLSRALRSYGGQELTLAGYTCRAQPTIEGPNKIWEECVVQVGKGDDAEAVSARLFGLIVEREGHFKFVTYGNDL